jgi:hypothetical protein
MMTIAKEFTDWQKKGKSAFAQFNRESPALSSLRDYLIPTYGGADLGIYGVRRVRGSLLSWSSHSFGSALDYSYRGLPREVAIKIIEFLISNSEELGVQAIHDYVGGRIWRANRSGDKNGGWQKQRKNKEGMGQTWGDWLHIEVNERKWADGRSVLEKLGSDTRRVLRRGDSGDDVKIVQSVLRDKAGQTITVDGKFGSQTEMAVRNVQAFVSGGKGPVTGVVDSEFWKVIDLLNQK